MSPGASRWLKYREKLLSFYSFFVGMEKLPPACSHPEEFTYPSSGQSCRGFLLLSSLTDPKNRRLPHIKGLTAFTHDKGFDAAPVTVLKVEKDVDTSHFTIPPATALSRIIFQSKTLNGSLSPVSAFILWLYSPRNLIDGHPVVAWSHGTSGIAPNCAPSHYKNLWQHSLAPYQLVLQSFVVVAADYAGLGVGKDALGKPIVFEYLASSSHAHDVFSSVQATQT